MRQKDPVREQAVPQSRAFPEPQASSEPQAEGTARAPALQVERVSFCYGETSALESVSLAIAAGEKVALLGANGSGKSTLLKMMDGLVFPQSGVMRAFGQEVNEAALRGHDFSRAFRSRVGFVFQNSDAQLFSASVREEIAFGPLHLGLSDQEVEVRVSDCMHIMGVQHLADRPPYHLSGGEKKRVALASVLAMNPDVLLFDEPSAGLDPKTESFLLHLIEELNAAGKTIVTATQDLDIVARIADRAIILGEDHRLAGEGEPAALLADRELLLAANLIHEHSHRHGDIEHFHPHSHVNGHDHEH